MSNAALLCRYARTLTLAAGVATPVDVPIDHAKNWLVVVKNVGGADLDTVTAAASPLGTLFEAPASITTGLPLASGASLPGIRGLGEPVATLRLTLTSTTGTDVQIEAGGW